MQERAFADPKIEFVWNSEVAAIHGDRPARVADPARHRDRREPRARRRPACSSRSATTRARSCCTGQVDLDDDGYVLVAAPLDPHQPARRLRLPATWSTTTTARPSPPPAPAARPPSTPSATSPTLDHARVHRRRGRRHRPTRSPSPVSDARGPFAPGRNNCPRAVVSDSAHRAQPSGHGVRERHRRSPVGKHARRHRRRVRDPGPQVRQARAGRLLGRVVRSVPSGRPDPRRDRRRARRQDHVREDERRREPRDAVRPTASTASRRSTSTRAARSCSRSSAPGRRPRSSRSSPSSSERLSSPLASQLRGTAAGECLGRARVSALRAGRTAPISRSSAASTSSRQVSADAQVHPHPRRARVRPLGLEARRCQERPPAWHAGARPPGPRVSPKASTALIPPRSIRSRAIPCTSIRPSPPPRVLRGDVHRGRAGRRRSRPVPSGSRPRPGTNAAGA